jgi:hypothetical protein
MRRGQVGGFGDHLSPADLAYVESTLAAELSAAAKGLLRQAGLAALR